MNGARSTLKVGDELVFLEDGKWKSAVVELVLETWVLARPASGETLNLLRSDLEMRGYAENGSVWDLFYTAAGFSARQTLTEEDTPEGLRARAEQLRSAAGSAVYDSDWGSN